MRVLKPHCNVSSFLDASDLPILHFQPLLLSVRIPDLVPHVLTFFLILIQGIIWRECNSAIAMDLHLVLHYLSNRQSG
jgi:hypothetical protein